MSLAAIAAAPFKAIAAPFVWAINLNGDQIRALMCWAMLGGIAALGFTNIGLTYTAHHAIEAGEITKPFTGILIEQIRYNSALQALMIAGVVMIAVQAGTLRAKLGDMIDFEAQLKAANPPQE